MRCVAGLAECPLKAIEKSLPVIVQQILDINKQAGNTESELVQVAFKSLATVLRDGPPVEVKEKDLVFLIPIWKNQHVKRPFLPFCEPLLPASLSYRKFTTLWGRYPRSQSPVSRLKCKNSAVGFFSSYLITLKEKDAYETKWHSLARISPTFMKVAVTVFWSYLTRSLASSR